MGRRLAAVALLLAVPLLAAADPGLEYTPPAAPAAPDVTGLILRLFALTAGMIALCGGVVWVVRRVKQPAAAKGDTKRLKHEGSLPLDRKCAVHLIHADGHTVAVTTDATGLKSMVVLSEPFEQALDEAAAQGEAAASVTK